MGRRLTGAFGLSGPLGIAVIIATWFARRRVGDRLEGGEGLSIGGLIGEVKEGFRDLRERLTDRVAAPAQVPMPATVAATPQVVINVPTAEVAATVAAEVTAKPAAETTA